MWFLFKYYYELIAPLFIKLPINSLTRCRFWCFRRIWDLWDKQTIYYHNNKVSDWPIMYINKNICKIEGKYLNVINNIIKWSFFFILPLLYPLFALVILFKVYKNSPLSLYSTYKRIILNPELFLFTDSLDSKYEWLNPKYYNIELYISHFITKIISTIQNSQIDNKIVLNELCQKFNIPNVPILFTINASNIDSIFNDNIVSINKNLFVKIKNGSSGSHAYRIQYKPKPVIQGLDSDKNFVLESYNKLTNIITNIPMNKSELYMFFKNQIFNNSTKKNPMEFIVQEQLKNTVGIVNIETLGVFRIKTYKYNSSYNLHCAKYYMPIKDTIVSQGNNKLMLYFENNKVSVVKNLQTNTFENIENYDEFNKINLDQAVKLCLDAHKKIGSECFYIGWDVVYNNGNYQILEANTPCGISSIEQKYPMEKTIFGQTLISYINCLE